MIFRYCAVAPTVLAGQIDPVLFEALYVSSNFFFFYVGANYSSTFLSCSYGKLDARTF